MTPEDKAEMKLIVKKLKNLRDEHGMKAFATGMMTVLTDPVTVPGVDKRQFFDWIAAAWDQYRDPNFVPLTSN